MNRFGSALIRSVTNSVRGGCVILVVMCAANNSTLAQDDGPTAAVVANQMISVRQVEALLQQTLDDRPLNDNLRVFLQAKALDQLVGQLLVVEYLRGQGKLVSDDDVQLALERLKQELSAVDQPLEEYLRQEGLTESELKSRLQFRLSWRKYLEASLTEENLRKHFERFRRELDGTRLHVGQILLRSRDASVEQESETWSKAAQLRQDILAQKISWEDAVREHSQAASREEGGDLGWIERHVPMPEAFSKAAFALEPDEISEPVRTEFGVHLIRCLEVQPGSSPWEDVEPAVRRHATQFLFEWIVAKQVSLTPPQFTGSYPYWDAAQNRVVPASR